MFDIGFIEMLVVGLILLLVVGPERLPEVARTVGGWVHQAKQYVESMKSELDRDLQLGELDKQTRQATDTRSSVEGTGSKPDGGGQGQAEAAGSAAGEGEPAAGAAAEGPEAPAASEADGEDGPDPEDQAAAELERELKDDDHRDDEHRG